MLRAKCVLGNNIFNFKFKVKDCENNSVFDENKQIIMLL